MEQSSLYGFPVFNVNRDFFFNAGTYTGFGKYLMLLIFITVVGISLWKFSKHLSVLRNGELKKKILFIPVVKNYFKNVLLRKGFIKEFFSGTIHYLLTLPVYFYILLMLIYFFDLYVFKAASGKQLLYGYAYLIWTFLVQLCGIVFSIGVLILLYRRLILNPQRLITTKKDIITPLVFVVYFIVMYSEEALRIAIIGRPEYEKWSFISYKMSAFFPSSSTLVLETFHFILWLFLPTFVLAAFLFWDKYKLKHSLMALYNLCINSTDFYSLKKYNMNINPVSFYTYERNVVCPVDVFSYKDKLQIEACLQCGRCHDVCPASISEKELSPRDIMRKLQSNVTKNESSKFVPGIVSREHLYDCMQCGACSEVCPSGVDPMDKIITLCTNQALCSGNYTKISNSVFDNIEDYGNVFGKTYSSSNLEILKEYFPHISKNTNNGYLLFIGCVGRYSDSHLDILKKFSHIMKKAGLDIYILGDEESCCGDAALSKGNEFVFRKTAEKNISNFEKYNLKKIITICPHGYNIIKKEYRTISKDIFPNYKYEVFHYTEILKEIAEKDQLDMTNIINKDFVFHDPCYLARYNPEVEIGRSLLTDSEFHQKEMKFNQRKTLCCGGIDSMMKIERPGIRPQDVRTREAYNTGASTLITSCPVCYSQFKKSIDENPNINMEVSDIIDFFYDLYCKQ